MIEMSFKVRNKVLKLRKNKNVNIKILEYQVNYLNTTPWKIVLTIRIFVASLVKN